MSIAEICLVIGYADPNALSLADVWLARIEMEASGARLIKNAMTYEASRKARRNLVTGKAV